MKIALVLGLAVASLPLTVRAAQTIDCKSALSASEYAVCNSPSLLKLDSRLMADIDLIVQQSGGAQTRNPSQLNNFKKAFGATRDKCGPNETCIFDFYKKQLTGLDHAIDQIRLRASPGMQ
jgi:uncharacterized protein